ncbi:helix-turn-helix domain-containing protein [Enterococcus sp. 669A]|uniref:Helix-turn-helix domain-containing protein n=1 Tax=Candidatus Enterococcus moelleringii TaxID=2815325 RepID=A0ABS3LCI3_9ENTE|nr:helix-turn-helix domain-containing protein [Enterococcus sp. 669A]MBO1306109.1 helix-turn-helix domain-containing protein [Enterococcus sp. 669A]
MNLFTQVLTNLEEFSPRVITETPFNHALNHVYPIQMDTKFSSNTIYVGYASQITNKLPFANGLTLFLIDDAEDFQLSADHVQQHTLVFFPFQTDIRKLIARTQKVIDQHLAQLRDAYTLFQAYLDQPDIMAALDAASILIKNPMIVLDTSFNVLAYSQTYVTEDAQWLENITRGYCSYEYIAGFLNIAEVRNSPENIDPFFTICYTSPFRRCVTKIYHGEKHIGYAIAIESHNSLEKVNGQIYQLVSQLLSQIIHTNQQLSFNKAIDRILVDCLAGKVSSRKHLQDRLKDTQLEPVSSYYLLAIDVTFYKIFDIGNEQLREHLNKLFNQAWSVFYQEYVVVLIDAKRLNQLTVKDLLLQDRPYFVTNGLHGGLSDTFDDLLQAPAYYQQAVSALEIGMKLRPDEPIAEYDAYKFQDLLRSLANSTQAQQYFSQSYQQIMIYDQKHDTQYLETLRAYLDCDRHLDTTAKMLHVHKNTIVYRTKKIKELFAIDFDDPKQRFDLLYSFYLADLLAADLLH